VLRIDYFYVNLRLVSMANILITNLCNQNCLYCFATNEFKRKGKQEIPFSDFKKVLSFLNKSGDNKVRLMGGEPTLHSEFKKIIDYSFKNKFSVQIFTNGIFSTQTADFLIKKGDGIKYSFNINPPECYSPKTWRQILKNLGRIVPFKKSLVGTVLWQKDFNIDYLLDFVEKFYLGVIILRIANPIINRKNQFLHLEEYSALAKNLIREIKKTDKNKVRIGLGCGFPKEMFSKKQLEILRKYGVISKGWGCDGNSGRFDIETDLSVFRCFPLSNWKTKKLSDFNKVQEIEKYFDKLMKECQMRDSKKDFIHQGPCFSHLPSKKL